MWFDEEIHEHELMCPYCWETITILLDSSVRSQSYVEDCEVCCNAIEISYRYDYHGNLIHFSAEPLGQ